MTVGELKRAIRDMPNDALVVVDLPEKLDQPGDYMAEIKEAVFVPEGPINNEELWLKPGRTYGY